MISLSEGDLVTLHFDGDQYLLCKVVHVEKLTLHDLIHFTIYDTLLPAGPEGYDAQGVPVDRTHELPEIDQLSTVIDHIALTASAVEDSDPLVVGRDEVSDLDLKGYAAWVTMRRQRAERRGMIRYDVDEELDEDVEEDEIDENETVDDTADENPVDSHRDGDEGEPDESGSTADSDDDMEAEAEVIDVPIHTWHDTTFEVPVSTVLVELADVFEQDEFEGSTLADAVAAKRSAAGTEIQEHISALIDEGDYGAGQELLMYGDAAAEALGERVDSIEDPDTLADVLQILGDIGSEKGYETIGSLFEATVNKVPDDPVAVAAARAFCYVVMLTGGTPDPLQERLELIERLDYPDLRDDAEEAIRAIHSQGTGVPEEGSTQTSADPFSSLGG